MTGNSGSIKIAYVTAGAAGMYCGSCINDNGLARELSGLGHDIVLIPTYTPTRTDETNVSSDQIFLGGINMYLQQRFRLFRKTPRWIDRLFDNKWLLGWVSRFSSSTSAKELGEMTLSMLRGDHGNQAKEIERMAQWLSRDFRPHLVHLPNSMFAGLAGPLRKLLGVPVVCSLQGEDLFLDDLVEPYRSQVLELLREKTRDVSGFVATSEAYKQHMSQWLEIPHDRVHAVGLGVDVADFQPAAVDDDDTVVIGYLARICPEKGLDRLVDAFIQLAPQVTRDVRLRVAGYLGKKDEAFYREQQRKTRAAGLADRCDWLGEVDRQGKIDMLGSLHVFCVPTRYKEAKGIFALEAMASALPIVAPAHGSFPELLRQGEAGLLVDADSEHELVKALKTLVEDRELRRALGQKAHATVHGTHTRAHMAADYLRMYQTVLTSPPSQWPRPDPR